MSDDEEESNLCPLCVEEMDLSDKNFLPCPCGYRVCMWCWHHIRENLNGLCPACRTPYNADPHAFSAVDRQEVVKKNRERKQKEKDKKGTEKPPIGNTAAKSTGATIDRKHLHNYRVVQRNLVYVIGIPVPAATEEQLRKPEYFGQYGKISKVVIHRNHAAAHTTVSSYVTFVYKEDAKAAIQALDGYWVDGHQLRASFGTTKYCNNFIRGVPCNNPECVYLHDLGDDDDRFTKEEIQAGHSKLAPAPGKDQVLVTGNGGPSGTGKRPSGDPILPPPVFIQDSYIAAQFVATNLNGTAVKTPSAPPALNRSATWSATTEGALNSARDSPAPPPAASSEAGQKSSPSFAAALSGAVSAAALELPPATSAVSEHKSEPPAPIPLKRATTTGGAESVKGTVIHDAPVPAVEKERAGRGTKDHKESAKQTAVPPEESSMAAASEVKKGKQQHPQTVKEVLREPVIALALGDPVVGLTAASNGLTRSAVFPVPLSSLSVTIWSTVAVREAADLSVDPYCDWQLPFSDYLELTMPPVDAVAVGAWPRPMSYYRFEMPLAPQKAPVEAVVPQVKPAAVVVEPVVSKAAPEVAPKKEGKGGPRAAPSPVPAAAPALSIETKSLQAAPVSAGATPVAPASVEAPASAAGKGGAVSANTSGKSTASQSNISALRQIFPGVNIGATSATKPGKV